MKRFLKINAADNVAVALADDLHEGETLDVEGVAVTLREDVARGHKFALRDNGNYNPLLSQNDLDYYL